MDNEEEGNVVAGQPPINAALMLLRQQAEEPAPVEEEAREGDTQRTGAEEAPGTARAAWNTYECAKPLVQEEMDSLTIVDGRATISGVECAVEEDCVGMSSHLYYIAARGIFNGSGPRALQQEGVQLNENAANAICQMSSEEIAAAALLSKDLMPRIIAELPINAEAYDTLLDTEVEVGDSEDLVANLEAALSTGGLSPRRFGSPADQHEFMLRLKRIRRQQRFERLRPARPTRPQHRVLPPLEGLRDMQYHAIDSSIARASVPDGQDMNSFAMAVTSARDFSTLPAGAADELERTIDGLDCSGITPRGHRTLIAGGTKIAAMKHVVMPALLQQLKECTLDLNESDVSAMITGKCSAELFRNLAACDKSTVSLSSPSAILRTLAKAEKITNFGFWKGSMRLDGDLAALLLKYTKGPDGATVDANEWFRLCCAEFSAQEKNRIAQLSSTGTYDGEARELLTRTDIEFYLLSLRGAQLTAKIMENAAREAGLKRQAPPMYGNQQQRNFQPQQQHQQQHYYQPQQHQQQHYYQPQQPQQHYQPQQQNYGVPPHTDRHRAPRPATAQEATTATPSQSALTSSAASAPA